MKTFFKKIILLFGIYFCTDSLITIICYTDLSFKDMSYQEIKTYLIAIISFIWIGYFSINVILDLIKNTKE